MKPKELTIRGLILGALITTIFTAANVYLGLKVGLTFASSIPAAVISMAILSMVKDSSILENNIVQTVASAAGTLSAIIFVLPGLVIVGWWTGFPFWQSFLICLSGGVLGVLFTIPLRRALVTNSDLPYPEGVAAAEVLKVGSGARGETKDDTGESKRRTHRRRLGSVASAGLAILTATRIAAASVTGFFRLGIWREGYDIAFFARPRRWGHLVGLSVGMADNGLVTPGRCVPSDVDAVCGGRRVTGSAYHIYLAHAGAVHRSRSNCDRGNLYPRETREASCRRARQYACQFSVNEGTRRPRPRSLAAMDSHSHGRLPGHQRLARLHLCALDCARAQRPKAHTDRRAVRAHYRFSHRWNLRLHGGTDRASIVRSPRGHSLDCDLCFGTNRRSVATTETRPALVALPSL